MFSTQSLLVFFLIQAVKISFFNARGFKPGHFDTFDFIVPLTFLSFLQLQESRSHDDFVACTQATDQATYMA